MFQVDASSTSNSQPHVAGQRARDKIYQAAAQTWQLTNSPHALYQQSRVARLTRSSDRSKLRAIQATSKIQPNR